MSEAAADCVSNIDSVQKSALPGISVVVPVYNSAPTISELVSRLEAVISKLHESFEIVLVNDGSKDESWAAIAQVAQTHSSVRGICLSRNYGQHSALLCGIRAAHFDVVVTLDDDLQHPPEEIPHLIKALVPGVDVAYGVPVDLPHAAWRNLTSRAVKWMLGGVMRAQGVQRASAFRALRTSLRDGLKDFHGPDVSIDVLLSWVTTRFTTIIVDHQPRKQGRSNYTFWKLVEHALASWFGFSTAPLRLAVLLGFAFTLFGLAVLTYVIVTSLVRGSQSGFPFLASTIAIFGGVELFAIGIVGEYLARLFSRSSGRPTYVIRTTEGPTPSGSQGNLD